MKSAIVALLFCLLGAPLAAAQAPPVPPAPPAAPEPPAPPPPPPAFHASPLTQAEEVEALEFAINGIPDRKRHLTHLKNDEPQHYYEVLRHALMEKEHLKRLEGLEPEEHKRVLHERELDARAFRLAEKYRRESEGVRKTEIRGELEALVAELFELREERREAEIQEINKELKRLSSLAEKRRKHKDEIIQRRVDDLCGVGDIYEW